MRRPILKEAVQRLGGLYVLSNGGGCPSIGGGVRNGGSVRELLQGGVTSWRRRHESDKISIMSWRRRTELEEAYELEEASDFVVAVCHWT